MPNLIIVKKKDVHPGKSRAPESFIKGEEFEKYVRNILFPKPQYDLIERPHRYEDIVDDVPESVKKPDFKFRDRLTKKEFYIEAKFRSDLFFDKISLAKPYQLERYQRFNEELPVFLLLGFKHIAANPLHIFLISLRHVEHTDIEESVAKKYEIPRSEHVPSNKLWEI